MPANGHAILSASASHRWLNCPPSVRLCENYEDLPSDFAEEGSDAHQLCENKLNKALGVIDELPEFESKWFNQEMEDASNGYTSFIMEIVNGLKEEGKDPLVLVEQRLDFSRWAEDSFGTGDCVITADGLVHVIDFKYGRGVLVEAEKNPQMLMYSLGALELFDCLYDIKTIRMTIYQPRLGNVSTYETTKEDLLKWANDVLVPMAKLAFKGEGEYSCGEWCKFCKAKANCRERAKHNLALAKYDFKEPPLLSLEEIASVLLEIDTLVLWADDVKRFAFKEAMNGNKIPGFKLVEGRSTRKFSDDEKVASIAEEAGFNPYDKKLVGITEMQKRMGKSKFVELLDKYIIKPAGKPTLVVESDKRPELNTAKQDFMTQEDN